MAPPDCKTAGTGESPSECLSKRGVKMNQTELLSSVRKGFEAAQVVATTRLESLEGDAKRVVTDLFEKGRNSQRQLTERIQRIADSETVRNSVRPVEDAFRKVPVSELRTKVEKAIDDLARRFGHLQANTRDALETASREQLQVLARELRRIAERLAELAGETSSSDTEGASVETTPDAPVTAAPVADAAVEVAAVEAAVPGTADEAAPVEVADAPSAEATQSDDDADTGKAAIAG